MTWNTNQSVTYARRFRTAYPWRDLHSVLEYFPAELDPIDIWPAMNSRRYINKIDALCDMTGEMRLLQIINGRSATLPNQNYSK